MTGIHASVDACPRAVSFGAPVVSTKLRMLLLSALTGGSLHQQPAYEKTKTPQCPRIFSQTRQQAKMSLR
jgi:hypothetical protein